MAERKYTGTDADLLRMRREGLSVRAIAAEVGIGKSVVGARIARAEEAERARAEVPASAPAISGRADSGAAWTSSADPHLGPISVRASLEGIAQDPKAGYRERLGALQTLAKMGKAADGPPSDEIRPRRIGTLALEPQRRQDGTFTYRLWLRERPAWTSSIDGLSPRQAWGLLGCALLADELGRRIQLSVPDWRSIRLPAEQAAEKPLAACAPARAASDHLRSSVFHRFNRPLAPLN